MLQIHQVEVCVTTATHFRKGDYDILQLTDYKIASDYVSEDAGERVSVEVRITVRKNIRPRNLCVVCFPPHS